MGLMGSAILLAVANYDLQRQVKWLLLRQEVEVLEASSNPAILECLQNSRPHLLILESPQNNGTDTLEIAGHIRRCDRRFPIILVTAHGSEALAVVALKGGVKDYFKQPFSPEEFVAAVNRCISDRLSQHSCIKNKSIVPYLADRQQLIGESPFICRVKAFLLKKVAAVDSHVLITGETGTGKELTAQYIHQQSTRHGKPLIAINCAALPDGLLESELFGYEKGAFTGAHTTYAGKLKLADGGTVFFDEIGDMSPYAQGKILRVIESKEVYPLGGKRSIPLDIRIIAATNGDLEHLVAKGKFRQDLYFQLNIARVQLPPLRERKEDIPHLVDHYLQEFNNRLGGNIEGFTDEALELLLRHD
jgi:DNA-binding NtrC family response regulator